MSQSPPWRLAITSQNLRTVTAHAGKTRRFLLFTVQEGVPEGGDLQPSGTLELPLEKALATYKESLADHPLFQDGPLTALITGGCGEGFVRRMAREGVAVHVTGENDPLDAIQEWRRGRAA